MSSEKGNLQFLNLRLDPEWGTNELRGVFTKIKKALRKPDVVTSFVFGDFNFLEVGESRVNELGQNLDEQLQGIKDVFYYAAGRVKADIAEAKCSAAVQRIRDMSRDWRSCGRRFAFPPGTLHQLKDLGHRVEARRLEIYARACTLRSAISSDKLHDLKNELKEYADSDDVVIAWRYSPYAKHSLFLRIGDLYNQFFQIHRPLNCKPKAVQARVTKMLLMNQQREFPSVQDRPACVLARGLGGVLDAPHFMSEARRPASPRAGVDVRLAVASTLRGTTLEFATLRWRLQVLIIMEHPADVFAEAEERMLQLGLPGRAASRGEAELRRKRSELDEMQALLNERELEIDRRERELQVQAAKLEERSGEGPAAAERAALMRQQQGFRAEAARERAALEKERSRLEVQAQLQKDRLDDEQRKQEEKIEELYAELENQRAALKAQQAVAQERAQAKEAKDNQEAHSKLVQQQASLDAKGVELAGKEAALTKRKDELAKKEEMIKGAVKKLEARFNQENERQAVHREDMKATELRHKDSVAREKDACRAWFLPEFLARVSCSAGGMAPWRSPGGLARKTFAQPGLPGSQA
ncbi:unnamed protein product [Prorocentrum cordatum]|uniref:Uncharacterized protein n=1 Tax=Prorocentrum cordatum TaxID=2364126 RepID=A0ABN9WZE1_9DINO|nr:unnamed protein product [Polarella glacialis]